MPRSSDTLVSFSSGEWSETLSSRIDQAKYKSACKQLRNMVALKTGPATRRPGTEFIAGAKLVDDADLVARMQEFVFSVNTSFMLEWGQNYVRFYSNGEQVHVTSADVWISGSGIYQVNKYVTYSGAFYRCIADIVGSTTPPPSDPSHWVQQSTLELYTPYDADQAAVGGDRRLTEVYQLQFAQINDVMYVVHKNHPRWILTRVTDELWTFREVQEMTPPLRDQNATNVKIGSSASEGTTTLSVSAPAWAAATYYERGDVVRFGGLNLWQAQASFISEAVFSDDLLLFRWEPFEVFQQGHVGSYWELSNLLPAAQVQYEGVAATGFSDGETSPITVYGEAFVRTYGVWSANVEIQGSTDGGTTWEKLSVVAGRSDRNTDIKVVAAVPMLMKIVVTSSVTPVNPGATDPRVVLEAPDAFLSGIVKITAVATTYQATAEVVTQLAVANAWVSGAAYFVGDRVGYDGVNYIALNDVTSATTPPADPTNWSADGWPTEFWSEGAWSEYRGYPRAIAAFQQKIFCGFNRSEPLRIWGTQTADFENWDLGDQSLATDGVAFDLDATGDGSGVWLAGQDALFAGFEAAEWVVQGSDGTGTIGPTSVSARRQSRFGSNPNMGAKLLGDALVFADFAGFTVRQFLFSVFTGKYMSSDLTVFSPEMMNAGAVQFGVQRNFQKNTILWAATLDGELVGMTYDLDQEIFGWHRHTTGDRNTDPPESAEDDKDVFESVAVIPGQDGNDDEVWVCVLRTIDGEQRRYIERLNPVNWYRQTDDASKLNAGYPADKNQAYYVDSGRTFENPVSNTFSGFDHLEGMEVAVCINAVDYGRFTVFSGDVVVDTFDPTGFVGFVHIGLPFTSKVQPLNPDADARLGVTKGLVKGISQIDLALYDTMALTYSDGSGRDGATRYIEFGDPNDVTATPQLFTGNKRVDDFPGEYADEIPVILYTNGPLPMTVLSLTIGYEVSERP